MAKKLRKSTKQSKHLTAFAIKHVLFNSQSTAETQKEKHHCFSQVPPLYCRMLISRHLHSSLIKRKKHPVDEGYSDKLA